MKMRIVSISLALAAALLLLLGGCSEPAEEELESPHPEGWEDPNSANFHGDQASDLSVCAACHGADFQGGNAGVACSECHDYPHVSGWASADAHGAAAVASGFDLQNCSPCHLTQVSADSVSWDCWSCHVYFPHDSTGITAYKHGGIFPQMHYQVWLCQACHGSDYSGGVAEKSCQDCHAYGPEACNTCHGIFNADPTDSLTWAPPPDVLGQTSTSLITIGAHRQHVNPSGITTEPWIGGPYSCTECHIQPASVNAPTHLDTLAAQTEITFGSIATAQGDISPVWLRETGECSGTYCHGNFELGNADNPAPVWTVQDGSQIACGTCHLLPPSSPHVQISNCNLCHGNVVAPDNVTIIAPDRHVNGVEN